MEYAAAAVWDPHHVEDTHELKEAQPRSARCALNDHGQYGSVTLMLQHFLGWDTLKLRCTMTRLQTLIKIMITKELLLYRIEFYTVISFH